MSEQRKNLLINKEFQIKFISYFLALYFIAVMTFFCAVNYYFYKLIDMGKEIGLEKTDIYFSFIAQNQFSLNVLLAVVSIVIMILMLFGGLYMSQKVAGPLYRFVNDIQKLNKDNIDKIKFRDGDYFKEVSTEFNNFVERIKQ